MVGLISLSRPVPLLVPSVTDRPGIVAAAVAGVVAVASSGLPSGLNIVAGALAGIAAARVVSQRVVSV